MHHKKASSSFGDVFGQNETADWATILNNIDPSEIRHISNYLSLTRDETFSFGHQLDEILVLCDFDHSACSKSDFKSFAHDVYGICHTFNHGLEPQIKPKTTSHIGAEYGLKLVLFVDQVNLLVPT